MINQSMEHWLRGTRKVLVMVLLPQGRKRFCPCQRRRKDIVSDSIKSTYSKRIKILFEMLRDRLNINGLIIP